MIAMGDGAIAIPTAASVQIIKTSATEERASQTLERNPRDVGVRK
jgi:hypothetical protein